jgi:hypothetical protein
MNIFNDIKKLIEIGSRNILIIILVDFAIAVILAYGIYVLLSSNGAFISMKDVQVNLRDQLQIINKDSAIQLNYKNLGLNEAYRDDLQSFLYDKKEINNYVAIKILNAAKEEFPSQIDLEKVFVQQRVLLIFISLLSGLIGYTLITLLHSYWFRLKAIKISADLPSSLEPPIDFALSDIIPRKFSEIVESFTDDHSVIITGVNANYPFNFVGTILNWKKDKPKSRTGVEIIVVKCGVWDYNDLAEKLLQKSVSSIKSTTYYHTNKLLKLFSDPSDEKKLISWLDKANEKAHANDSFTINRVHIIDTDDDFIIKYNQPSPGDKEAIVRYDEKYRCIFNSKNINFDLYILGESNVNKNGETDYTYPPDFFGEYIIFDSSILLKYDEKFQVLEIYFGEIVKAFTNSFADEYKKKGTFKTNKLRSYPI